jgi:hypothetical protein
MQKLATAAVVGLGLLAGAATTGHAQYYNYYGAPSTSSWSPYNYPGYQTSTWRITVFGPQGVLGPLCCPAPVFRQCRSEGQRSRQPLVSITAEWRLGRQAAGPSPTGRSRQSCADPRGSLSKESAATRFIGPIS